MRAAGVALAFAAAALALACAPAAAQKQYGPGVTDTEIRIGQTMPYSGPVSALGALGHSAVAYFAKVNAEGGINGRKVNLISLDDAYSPPKTVEHTRRLVEQDKVLAIFQTLGTATNASIHKYLNQQKVPHLLITSGANRWADPKNFPWTMSGMPSYDTEARIYARYILERVPNARIAVLSQNDDFGRDYLSGFEAGLGARAKAMIVARATYEPTDPTVDSQIAALKASGADVFFTISNGKFTSQSIRKSAELGWKPVTFLPIGSSSIAGILKPAGVERATGAITAAYAKNPSDPQWADDPGMKEYFAFMKQYMPNADPLDSLNASGFNAGRLMAHILRACGDNLTRENVMKQALSLKDFSTPLFLPGVTASTSPTDYAPFQQLRLSRFDGTSWVPFGDVISR